MNPHSSFLQLLLSGLLSGSVMAGLLGLLLARRTDIFRSRRSWKERSVAELLGPIHMQLERTRRAVARYRTKNTFLEAEVLRQGNLAVRDLLLKVPHLIPPALLEDASRLVEHYDRWLEEYERLRGSENPNLDALFVFVGPKGFPFPSDAEVRFHRIYQSYWNDLYKKGA